MGAAMAQGWLAAGLKPGNLLLVDPRPGTAAEPLLAAGVKHVTTPEGAAADIVVLAVKPQVMDAAMPSLAPILTPDTLVVSIAAGRTIASIEAVVGERPVVRAMPNTPALIGRGITGAYANERVSQDARATADALLSACGPVEWVRSEGEIDAVTAVSGSGPAYVFHLAEALAEAGAKAGLEPELAMRLARHTVAGAGELMIRAEEEPAQLRRNVTSPNGTTQAALDVLMGEGGLVPLMERAVAAAKARAEELSKG
ncbi:pyrroline-5-carboxylate reductase [Aureimonas mangrovi]|uniref:pyrroline-5-carboxylate reductase n=1 Tax=Aureimonas mangrovi TaxID=2758041 RepID=UPI001FE3C2FB